MDTTTATRAANLVVKHVSLPSNPLDLTPYPGSHEGLSDDALVLWRRGGDYNTGHDYWVDAAADNDALRADLRAMGLYVETVHAESIAVCPI